jgi:cytochrome c oxidase assembly protein Cox11
MKKLVVTLVSIAVLSLGVAFAQVPATSTAPSTVSTATKAGTVKTTKKVKKVKKSKKAPKNIVSPSTVSATPATK